MYWTLSPLRKETYFGENLDTYQSLALGEMEVPLTNLKWGPQAWEWWTSPFGTPQGHGLAPIKWTLASCPQLTSAPLTVRVLSDLTASLQKLTDTSTVYLWTQVGQVILCSDYDMLREWAVSRFSRWIFNSHLGTNWFQVISVVPIFMQMFTIQISLSPHPSLKLIRSYLYWAYFPTQVFMLRNTLKVIKWHLKHSIIQIVTI